MELGVTDNLVDKENDFSVVVFTPHLPVFHPSWCNFGLKFAFGATANIHTPIKSINFKTVA